MELEFLRQKWQHQKCDPTNRFAHPCLSICDIDELNELKCLSCTSVLSSIVAVSIRTPCITNIGTKKCQHKKNQMRQFK